MGCTTASKKTYKNENLKIDANIEKVWKMEESNIA